MWTSDQRTSRVFLACEKRWCAKDTSPHAMRTSKREGEREWEKERKKRERERKRRERTAWKQKKSVETFSFNRITTYLLRTWVKRACYVWSGVEINYLFSISVLACRNSTLQTHRLKSSPCLWERNASTRRKRSCNTMLLAVENMAETYLTSGLRKANK